MNQPWRGSFRREGVPCDTLIDPFEGETGSLGSCDKEGPVQLRLKTNYLIELPKLPRFVEQSNIIYIPIYNLYIAEYRA